MATKAQLYRGGKAAICAALFLASLEGVSAQIDTMSMTVTPAFFRISLEPGETWSSYIEVRNNSTYETPLEVSPMNFTVSTKGEGIKYAPDLYTERLTSYSPKEWIVVSEVGVGVLGYDQELVVPFSIQVPEDAEPGNYYAGLLVGEGFEEEAKDAQLKVSNLITSLMNINVTGEIVERGRIRELYSEQSVYETPLAQFVMRFENRGTVHLEPRGDITIYNMWGRERGSLQIGEGTPLESVVSPGETKEFIYAWEGERGGFEYGRFKAVAEIAYGKENKTVAIETRHFWILPKGALLKVGLPLLLVLVGIGLLIRWYIRRTIAAHIAKKG